MGFLADIVHDARREPPARGAISPPADLPAPIFGGPLEALVDTGPPTQRTAISSGAVPVSSPMPPHGLSPQASPPPPAPRNGQSSLASPSAPVQRHGPALRTSPLPPGDRETAVTAREAGPDPGPTRPVPPAVALSAAPAGAPGAARVNTGTAARASAETVDAIPVPVVTPKTAPVMAAPGKPAAAARGSRPAVPAADAPSTPARGRPGTSLSGRAAAVAAPSPATPPIRPDRPAASAERAPAGERFSEVNAVAQYAVPDQRSFSSAADAVAPEQPPLAFAPDRQALNAVKALERPPGQPAWGADAAPRIHIGRIDIVVQAPETPRPAPAPDRISSDAASRFYLRRL